MNPRKESAERLARPLIRLARAVGVATSYVGQSDDYHEIDDSVLVAVLRALDVHARDDAEARQALQTLDDARHARLVPPTVLHIAGRPSVVTVNSGILDVPRASLTLEDGSRYDGVLPVTEGDGSPAYPLGDGFVVTTTLVIPADVPVGYHTLHVIAGGRRQDATVISAPERIEPIDALLAKPSAIEQYPNVSDIHMAANRVPRVKRRRSPRMWGWMAQLYSIRSRDASWGVGDFADLRDMLTHAKRETDADFILVNPLHAGEPAVPLTPSPYLPVSRLTLNFTYIRPEDVPEYQLLGAESRRRIDELHRSVASLNADAARIDRDAMWRAKARALWIIYKIGRGEERQHRFDDYKRAAGDDLEAYATWCLACDKWGAPDATPGTWVRTRGPHSPDIRRLREEYPDSLDFYRWLEWVAGEQLDRAQGAAKRAGMRIGIMADMAVGVHPQGADVWWHPERYARGATVGAPPDYFNQQGQDWSQPPLSPLDLDRTGYAVYRKLVHGMFAHAGAVRIDHILGLFRLWWIPGGNSPREGSYVSYDSAIMLGVLAIEASRARGVVVGEDLGIVPSYVADSLNRHGVFGCVVEWFEQRDGVFRSPDQWREYALASVNTHDMPPAAGYLDYEHVRIRKRLHLLTGSAEEFERSARREHDAMLRMLVDGGWVNPEWLQDERAHRRQIIEAQYSALCASPSKLLAASVADGVGETRAQNQPGTNNEYPNWRIPLADAEGNVVPVEELFSDPRMQSLAGIMNGRD